MSNSISGHDHGRGAVARQMPAAQRSSRGAAAAIRRLGTRLRRAAAITAVLATMVLGSVQSANAAYVQRYATTTRGGVTFTGNTLGLSRASGTGGLTAPGTSDSIGAFSTTNTALQVGTYPAGTTGNWTLNSAAAMLALPAGSSVLHAELIWGATLSSGGEDISGSINTPISFTVPGNATPFTITPDAATAQLGGNFYIRSANVTALVQAAGAGSYVTGGVPGTRGNDNSGNTTGWTLAVVYGDNTKPVRNMTVFVGAEIGGAAAAQVSGFCTPPSGTLNGRVLVTALEGDANRTGDTFLFGPTATLGPANSLSGSNNPVGNFFVSQMNGDAGALDTSGTFGSRNHNAATGTNTIGGRQGWDITNVNGSAQLGYNQSSAFAQGTTTGDQYTIAGLGLQIDVFAPSFPVVVKAVDHASTFVGDVLTYTVTLQNTGGAVANNVLFNDPPPANTSFVAGSFTIDGVAQPAVVAPVGVNLGSIAIGAQKVVTFQVAVNSQPASLEIRNAAQWDYTYTACSSAIPGSVATNEVATPFAQADVAISKTDGSVTYTPGAPISYTLTVNNAGPDAASSFDISDSMPLAITGVSASCAATGTGSCGVNASSGNTVSFTGAALNAGAGNSLTVTISGTVAPGASGNLVNTATVDNGAFIDTNSANDSATDTDTAAPSANLAISKTDGSATYTPGGSISYTIVASNAGPSNVVGATVTDTLPAAITGASWTCVGTGGAACPASGSGNINASVSIPAGGSATFTVTGSVSASASGNLVNTVAIAPPAGTTDPVPGNNSATDTDSAAPSANLAISKTDGSATYTPGGSISYTIVASNAGPSNVVGATVADTLPAAITGASWTCVGAGGATCPAASGSGNINASVSIPAGGSATFTVTGSISASASGNLVNTAAIAPPAGTTDPVPGNNSATDTDSAAPSANLAISKTDGSATYTPGGAISYTIVASNAGPSNVVGATVADTLPAAITGASWTCVGAGGATCPAASGSGNINAVVNLPASGSVTFTVTGTVSASATGNLVNTATVTPPGGTTDPTPGNNSATDTDSAAPSSNLAISKTDGSATYTPGGAITYTIVASNAGPSDVIGATVSDTLPAGIVGASVTWTCVGVGGATCVSAAGAGDIDAGVDVPVGGSVTFTVTGTVSASATGNLVNTAAIAPPSGTTDPVPGNDTATDTDTAAPSADLTVVKTGPASIGYDGALSYSVVVSNNGPSNADGTTFSDVVPTGVSAITASCGTPTGGAVCGAVNVAGNTVSSTITTLPSGASVTFTIDGNAPTSGSTISNSATATPPGGTTDPVPGDNTDTATTTLLQPQLNVSKTASPSPFVVGQPASYTITVSNVGAGPTAGDITVDDSLPSGITLASASGANWSCSGTSALTCTFSGTLVADASTVLTLNVNVDASATSADNTASASGGGDTTCPAAAHCSDTVVVPVDASADIAVAKSVDNAAPNVGENVTFTITATNNGPNDATGVAITDALPSGLVFVSATPSQGTYVNGTGLWTVGALANGASATLQITATVLQTGALTNTATKTAGDQFDPDTSNNAGSASLNAQPSADLQVGKSVDNATPNLGTDATFTITLTNAGPNDATGVVIDDLLPLGLAFVSATASQGSYDDATGLWTVGALTNGASATLNVTATVTLPGDITNTATVASSDQHDPNPANNSGGVTVNGQSADIQLLKVVDNVAPVRGDTITFTITATNNGPSNATGVAITDALPAGLGLVSATPSQGTYNTATGVWTIGNLAASGAGATATLTIQVTVDTDADFTNTVTLSALDQPDPDPVNNSDSVSVMPVASADLEVVKTGPANATAGQSVSYTLAVTNHGPSPAESVSLDDPTPAGLTFVSATAPCAAGFPCALGTLANGATTSVTVTFSVPSNHGATITNTATVSSPTDTTPANNSSTVTTPLLRSADLEVQKTGPANVNAGGSVSYNVVVTNNGPSDANGALFSDPVPAALSGVTASCGTPTNGAVCGTVNVAGNTVSSTITTLPANGSVTFTINATAPANGTTLSNTASIDPPAGVTDPTPGNDDSTADTTVDAQADLTLVKTGPANAVPGTNVSYGLAVTNNGPSTATAVSLADPTPAGLTFVSASAPCAAGFPCLLGDLAVGASVNVTVVYGVPSGYSGSIVNTATVTSPTVDPTPGDNSDTVTTPTAPTADIVVTKTGPANIGYGGALSYTVVVSNNGPSNANGTTFSDAVPAGVSAITASCGTPTGGAVCGAVNVAGNTVSSTITTLPSSASVTFTINGTAPSTGTSITNTASATPPVGTTDPDPGSNSDSATTTLLQPQLSVSKSASPNPFVVGQAASYTITVTNNGAGPSAGNITISDNLPAGITLASASGANWSCIGTSALTCTFSGTLAAGASTALTLNVNVGASATTANNTATASGGGDPACPAAAVCTGTVVVPVQPSADVSIVKTGPATIASGATISYTLLIANAGPSAADNAAYSDSVPAAITGVSASCGAPTGGAVCAVPGVVGNTVSGTVPTLPAGASVTITITGTTPFGAQTLNNNASVSVPPGTTDPDPGNNDDSSSTTVGNAADIAVTKTVDNAAPNVGDSVTFTITATNNGPDDATGVALTDSLPFGFGFVSATPSQGSYDDATGLWMIGNLANGASVTLSMTVTIDQPGALTNTIAVSASDQPDPNTSNNNAGAAVNAGATADIAVAKTVDNAVPNVGDSVTYTVSATNNGPNDATGIEITDSLPAGVTLVAATPSQGTYDAGSGVWTVGALLNGAAATLTLTVTVDQAGAIMNTATITAEDQFDPVGANNEAGVSINGQEADLAVTKTVDNAAPNVGESVVFTITVHNNGPSDATGVELTDALPAGLAFDSATPSQGSYNNVSGLWTVGSLTAAGPTSTATLTIAATVTAAGAMTNTAAVSSSDQPDPNSANNSASASLNGNPLADLAVVKSGPATVIPGDAIVYTVVVTNNGPSDALNVVVVDPTPAGLTFVGNTGDCVTAYPCAIATLANGASATITTTYSVPANYTGANPIVNTASASSDTPDPDSTNNQGSAQTGVGPGNADLSIVKTGPASVLSGGAISYTLTISNAGPSPANGASYSDDVPVGITAISASCASESGGAACVTQPGVVGNLVSGTVGTLPSGGSVIVTINGTAPSGPAMLDNTATIAPPAGVNDPDPSDNSSTIGTGVDVPMADLAIEKTGPLQVVAGTTVTYTLSVTNNGPDSALGVSLDDPTPAGLSFVSASTPCQTGFPCALGDLASGASTIVTVTFAVDAALAGSIVNTASVGSPTSDPDPSDNNDTITTPVVPAPTSADLSISKSGPADVLAGSSVVYTIVVSNAGPDAAANVIVSDPTPAGLSFVGNAGACVTAYPCAIGSLASGASATITSTFAVPASYTGPYPIVNSASVGSDTPDPDGSDNGDDASTDVIVPLASADIAVVKTGPDTATPGTSVTYTMVVTNHGPDAVSDAMLEDPTPAGLGFVSASAPCSGGFPCALGALANGASTTVTATYQVQAGYTGDVANHANAHSPTVPDPDPDNDSDTATTVVGGGPVTPVTPVPVDARWMLMLMALLLMFVGAPLARRRR